MIAKEEIQKLQKEYPDFFKETPQGLLELALSDKTTGRITDICQKNGVTDEKKIEGIAYRFVWVLLGHVPEKKLAFTLEKGVGLKKEIAEKMAYEINQFISPLIVQLESKMDAQPKKELPKEKITPASAEASAGKEEKPKRSPGKDTYRESVE